MIEPCRALGRYPLFALLPKDWLLGWVRLGKVLGVEAGQTLFPIGSAGTHIFLILSGKVRVLRVGKGGREISMAVLGPGEVFGEYALLPPGLNTATCRAAAAGEVLQLSLPILSMAVRQRLQGRLRLKKLLRLHYLLAHLREQPSLGFMSGSSFLPLLDRFETVRFAEGDTVQADGFHDDRWFVIQTGHACVGGEADDPERRELGPGDCFGEAALLGDTGLPLVRAVADLQCHALRRLALEQPVETARSVSLQTVLSQRGPVPRCHEWIAQQAHNDCGVAALAMVARALGSRLSIAELRRQIHVHDQGTSLQELQRAAAMLGYRGQAVRIGLDHLAALRLPAIAHLAEGHYVVLFEVSPGGAIVGDPASGIGKWTLAALQRTWTGQILLVT